ncbi:MAG: DNA polymerase IV [Firmicutes bacterium]|nr:DNA polymerase IV [Bacillota bacterium]
MDAFYAAVEQHDHPELVGRPVIVGGRPDARGVVSTCSYEARAFGVRSAMPLREAARRCPHGVFLPVRMERYAEVSRQIFAILDRFSPLVEPLSLDEAFLDVTGCEGLFGPAPCIARRIVATIRQELGLSASVGVAPNKLVAKIASDLRKPGGFVVVRPGEVDDFLRDLSVRCLWGVGPRTEEYLARLGVKTIGGLRAIPREILVASLGEAGAALYDLCRGRADRPVAGSEPAKSLGQEMTFPQDVTDPSYLAAILLLLADRVARRAREAGVYGRTVVLKVRDLEFSTITRRRTLPRPTDAEEEIYATARSLAEAIPWWGTRPVRLLGVSLVNLVDASVGKQGTLFGPVTGELRRDRLHRAVDQIRRKYGEEAIVRARVMKMEE